MDGHPERITPAQCRAGRAIIDWTQAVLAGHAGTSRKTIADFELRRRPLSLRKALAIREALESAGVHFAVQDGVSVGGHAAAAPIASAFAPQL